MLIIKIIILYFKFFCIFVCIFYQMILISNMCRVIFSEYYFKDHIGNKCT